jgi:ribonuclease H / adenosylcobalamin/alpha-ribazole phosphatase
MVATTAPPWAPCADGASWGNPGPAAGGASVATPEGRVLADVCRGHGRATSNEAEYAGAVLALETAVSYRAIAVTPYRDSRLVVEQLTRALGLGAGWATSEPRFLPAQERIAELAAGLDDFRVQWIPRAQNTRADRLAHEAVATTAVEPSLCREWTRCSPQLWRWLSSAKRWPRSGWKGCVTRTHRAPSAPGAVDA